jgi:hypothetical protein
VLPAFHSLHILVNPPKWALHLVYEQSHPGSGMHRQAGPLLITAFCLAAALFLLAVITGLWFAAAQPFLLPVRRLARDSAGGRAPSDVDSEQRELLLTLLARIADGGAAANPRQEMRLRD